MGKTAFIGFMYAQLQDGFIGWSRLLVDKKLYCLSYETPL